MDFWARRQLKSAVADFGNSQRPKLGRPDFGAAPRNDDLDGTFMHELDIFHEHLMSDEERAAIAQYIWNQENVELSTIGIDIGSSTSHLLFAKVLLQRHTQGLSSRFVVVHRQVVWRSPIMLTPLRHAPSTPPSSAPSS